MSIGASLFLIAAGAILAFAVTAEVSGIDLSTVGWILMIVGGLGLCCRSSSGRMRGGYRRETYVREDPYDRQPPY